MAEKQRHIGIGIHSCDDFRDATVYSMIPMLMKALVVPHTTWSFVGGSRDKVASARNFIVEKLLNSGCTHWLSLDTDHVYPLDLVARLVAMDADDVGLCSGLIRKRGQPFPFVTFKAVNGVLNLCEVTPDSGVVELDGCAMGCTLVNIEAVMKSGVEWPWFVDSAAGRSDVNFYKNVRAKGLRILVDTGLHVGHIGEPQVIWPIGRQQ
jgi:hypothetical protein